MPKDATWALKLITGKVAPGRNGLGAAGGHQRAGRRLVAGGRDQLARAGFGKIDYLSVCDAETLEEASNAARPARVLAAAWLGKARLIDNVAV